MLISILNFAKLTYHRKHNLRTSVALSVLGADIQYSYGALLIVELVI